MVNAYTVIPVNNNETLRQHREAIFALFTLCFGHKIDPKLWDWAYQNNPCGDAYVHLAYKNKALVGHYAMIPQHYYNHTQQHTVALSMTTMVHPAHRRAGLFQTLAEASYAQASEDGVLAVLGFPNSKSTPGFKKRLQWQCSDDYQIVKTKTKVQEGADQFLTINPNEFCKRFQSHDKRFMLNLSQKDLLAWRLSKPGVNYMLLEGEQQTLFIVKPYLDTLDVVFASTPNIPSGLLSFAKKQGYSALMSFSGNQGPQMENGDGVQYRFGYRTFQKNNISFSPQLIMSDVF